MQSIKKIIFCSIALSPYLNLGLITPDIIAKSYEFSSCKGVRLILRRFIRQIIG